MISMGLLLAGLIAVGAVIVYKSQPSGGGTNSSDKGSEYALAKLQLPAGAEIVSVVAADGVVTVTYKLSGATSVDIVDGKTGTLIRSLQVGN